MLDTLILFDQVQLVGRDMFGFRCRVGEREIWIGNLQYQPGTTVHGVGDLLVLRLADAASLGLIDWTPPPSSS